MPNQRTPPRDYQISVTRQAMACKFEILLPAGEPPDGPSHADAALVLVGELEQLLSVYKPSSMISIVNQSASETPVQVDSQTFQLVQLAKHLFEKTDGAFDCTAAELTERWGFSRRAGRVPSETEIETALDRCGSASIELNENERTIYFTKPGLKINTGGIGKGFALDKAASSLLRSDCQSFLINGGQSSAKACGNQPGLSDGVGWRVAVRHPMQPARLIGELRLVNKSLGTSGPAHQFFYFNGRRYGHIIDPRTGYPADGWLSTTVVCQSAADADALATGLFVLGPTEAIRFCEAHTDIGLIGILPGKREGEVEVVVCNIPDGQWLPENART